MAFTPPESTTPLAVNVMVSPRQTVSGSTEIVPPDSTPLSSHRSSHGSLQHTPFGQQFATGQHCVPPQQTSPVVQNVGCVQAPPTQ
jgi:hypothetical protein